MTDQLLIDLYFARDKRAVAETKEKYGAWCAAIAWRLLRDSRDVEECLSDCALAVWNAIPPPAAGALQGLAGGHRAQPGHRPCRASGRWPATVDETALELAACLSAGDSPQGRAEAAELGRAISDFLRTQRPGARTAFLRRYWYAEGVEEVASRLGWSVSKTKSSLFRTRNKLREYLHQEGYLWWTRSGRWRRWAISTRS